MLLRRMQKFNCRHSAALSPMMRAFSIRGNGMNGFPITFFSFELNDLISQRIQKCLMRDEHDDGMRKLFAKQFNHFTCIDRIQPAGHLIEEQNIGLRNQRAQQRKPLNLTAREYGRPVRAFAELFRQMREAGFGKERCGPFVGEFIGGFRIGQRIKGV